jgi:hypothetical protein
MSEPIKFYFSYNQIHETVRQGAHKVISGGFEPDLLLAIGNTHLRPVGHVPAATFPKLISHSRAMSPFVSILGSARFPGACNVCFKYLCLALDGHCFTCGDAT